MLFSEDVKVVEGGHYVVYIILFGVFLLLVMIIGAYYIKSKQWFWKQWRVESFDNDVKSQKVLEVT